MAHDSCKHCNPESRKQVFTRRAFFDRVADGLYGVALTTLLSSDLYGAPAIRRKPRERVPYTT